MKPGKVTALKDFLNRPGWFRAMNHAWNWSYKIRKQPILDREDIIKAARKTTGLYDLGQDFWEEPLDRLIR